MAKISTYPEVIPPALDDFIIGTDVSNSNATKNFVIEDVLSLGNKYKVYLALVKPNGTNDPEVIEIENTLGNIIWTYESSGPFIKCFGEGLFTPNKTSVLNTSIISYSAAYPLHIQYTYDDIDKIYFLTTNYSGSRINVVANNSFTIEIRVYN